MRCSFSLGSRRRNGCSPPDTGAVLWGTLDRQDTGAARSEARQDLGGTVRGDFAASGEGLGTLALMATALVAHPDSESPVSASPADVVPIRAICRALERAYGSPRHGNPDDPLDDLIYIIISTRSHERRFGETYRQVKAAFPCWDDVTADRLPELETLLIPGGLGRLKARQIVSIVGRLRDDFGQATLSPLRAMCDAEVEAFLTSLWGVSRKVAKCVAMYALGRQVLPVDVHVHRVAGRLGLRVKKRPDTSQDWIEDAVPSDLRYGFHVNAIAHGRAVCRPRSPACDTCCVARWCRFGQELRDRG